MEKTRHLFACTLNSDEISGISSQYTYIKPDSIALMAEGGEGESDQRDRPSYHNIAMSMYYSLVQSSKLSGSYTISAPSAVGKLFSYLTVKTSK